MLKQISFVVFLTIAVETPPCFGMEGKTEVEIGLGGDALGTLRLRLLKAGLTGSLNEIQEAIATGADEITLNLAGNKRTSSNIRDLLISSIGEQYLTNITLTLFGESAQEGEEGEITIFGENEEVGEDISASFESPTAANIDDVNLFYLSDDEEGEGT